jgi:membrane fusion protein, copper/silver efflux system
VKETFPLLADVSGYVASKKVNLGDHVPQGAAIYEIADFSSLWVLFDVYEADMKWVKKGDKVDFTVSAFPGERFNGTVTFVDPAIDPKTRVAKARVEVKNKSLRLKPEMFVSGTLQGGLPEGPSVVVVPKSAVLWTGKRSLVYVKVASEQAVSFVMREVTLGPALGDSYVIESGLRAGEEIAVNGAFSIDAAAQLAGKPSMMSPAADGKGAAFNHDHMVMLTSNETTGQEASAAIPAAFVAQWTGYVKAYLKLKNELVNDSPSGAAKAAKEASNELKKVDMKLLTDHDMHMTWMKVLKPIQENTDLIGNSADITVQRDAFVRLSEAVIEAVGLFGIQGLTVYQQHCPMANSSKGADWLSLESEIKNPYYGASMLSCGSVEKTFNPIK